VLISGTVGAAMAAYLRGFPAIAISCDRKFLLENFPANRHTQAGVAPEVNWPYLKDISRFVALLAQRMVSAKLPGSPFLNINIPGRSMSDVKGIRITRLARKSHVNTVEEGHDGRRDYYMLVRESVSNQTDTRTDIWAVEHGNISVTPLNVFFNDRLPVSLVEGLTKGVMEDLFPS
jgi:5'-nucleotidase